MMGDTNRFVGTCSEVHMVSSLKNLNDDCTSHSSGDWDRKFFTWQSGWKCTAASFRHLKSYRRCGFTQYLVFLMALSGEHNQEEQGWWHTKPTISFVSLTTQKQSPKLYEWVCWNRSILRVLSC